MAGRPSSKDRARRLLALLPHLKPRTRTPLSQLAALAGTDEETTAADLTTLSLCGTDPLDAGSFVSVYVEGDEAVVFGDVPALDRAVRLTVAETRALATALEVCGCDPDGDLVTKLADAASAHGAVDIVAATVRAATAPGGLAHTYTMLVAATGAHRRTMISYAGGDDTSATPRTVHPWHLIFARGNWYLHAFCERSGEERTFRLDRISSVQVTGSCFDPGEVPATPAAPAPRPQDLPVAEVVFGADAPDLNERDWPGATFEPGPDGSVRASIPYAGTGWIARRIVARLGEAEVTAPPEVRAAVGNMARDLLA